MGTRNVNPVQSSNHEGEEDLTADRTDSADGESESVIGKLPRSEPVGSVIRVICEIRGQISVVWENDRSNGDVDRG